MSARKNLAVNAQLLIRRPAREVYAAFVDPAVTTRFWFTKASGPLVVGETVRWEWEMYGVGGDVTVKALEPGERILIEWGDPPTTVEWLFTPRGDDTLVQISNRGFAGSDDEIVAAALDAQGGFTALLAALKAWLEHGVQLELVADNHPDAVRKDWRGRS